MTSFLQTDLTFQASGAAVRCQCFVSKRKEGAGVFPTCRGSIDVEMTVVVMEHSSLSISSSDVLNDRPFTGMEARI